MNKATRSAIHLARGKDNANGDISIKSSLRLTASYLLILLFFFSCTDLQTANQDIEEPETPSKTEVMSGKYLIDSGLLPVPDIELYREAINTSMNKSAGTAKLFKRVMVHPKGEAPGSNGAPVVDNFADAIQRVESGGIIKVFAGEYELSEAVIIDRAVTIESKSGVAPVIRTADQNAFLVADVQGGVVTFKNLNFENVGGGASVLAHNSEVQVTGSVFNILNGRGVFAGEGAKLTIEESTFSGGNSGLLASGENVVMNVHSSSFSDHAVLAVQHQLGARGVVADNSMTDCGIWRCAGAVIDSQVDMLDNRFGDDVSDSEVNGFLHHIVIYSGATGRVSDNLFDGCGHGQCVGGINKSILEVSDNEFRIYEDHKTRFVIVGSDGFGGTDPEGREVDITVTDNLITGIGGNYKNDPGNPDAYAIKLGGLLIENLGRMEAHRNTIVNANMGISVLNGGVLSAGQDNIIQEVRTAVAAYDFIGLGESLANLQNNDFTDYFTSILNDTFDPDSDLTCNWWGTTAGPQNMQGAQSSTSITTPWATEPVAGSSVTSCTGVPSMPTSGLVAYWPGDGTAEDTAGNHDGTLIDDATYSLGKVNQAFYFPNTEKAEENGYHGSDWLEVPDHDAWDFSSGNFTIGTWVNFSSVFSSGDNQQPIMGHSEGPEELNKWIFWLENGAITFHVNTPDEVGHSPVWYPLDPDTDVWYHLTLTHEGDTWRLYVDGNLVEEVDDPVAIPDANFPLEIGKAENHWLEGYLDEVVIYDRALNSSEVNGLFLEGIN